MSLSNYETPPRDWYEYFNVFWLTLTLGLVLLLSSQDFSVLGFFIFPLIVLIMEFVGFKLNPKKIGDVHLYRPLSGFVCLFKGHKRFVNREYLCIERAMITCSRCGLSSFVSKKK